MYGRLRPYPVEYWTLKSGVAMLKKTIVSVIAVAAIPQAVAARPVTLWDSTSLASIISDKNKTARLAAEMLAHDLKSLTGSDAKVSTNLTDCGPLCVVIGTYDSPLVAKLAAQAGIKPQPLRGQWERYEVRRQLRLSDAPGFARRTEAVRRRGCLLSHLLLGPAARLSVAVDHAPRPNPGADGPRLGGQCPPRVDRQRRRHQAK
jgi:hypothetical protein